MIGKAYPRGGAEEVGKIEAFMRTSAPYGYLICDGSTYNIGDYPLLEELFTTDFGSVNYFGGDGTTTWKVPDLRGEFLRGSGTNGHSGQGSGATVGTHQDSTEHSFTYATSNGFVIPKTSDPINVDKTISQTSQTYFSGNTQSGGDKTTVRRYCSRPTNTSVLYCIRAY